MLEYGCYIDGEWRDATSGVRFDVENPATSQVWATVPRCGGVDVDQAVTAARRAFDEGVWGTELSERDRGRILIAIAALIRREADRLAALEVRDCDKPLAEAKEDIEAAAYIFEYYGGWATKIHGDVPTVGRGALSLVVKEPVALSPRLSPGTIRS